MCSVPQLLGGQASPRGPAPPSLLAGQRRECPLGPTWPWGPPRGTPTSGLPGAHHEQPTAPVPQGSATCVFLLAEPGSPPQSPPGPCREQLRGLPGGGLVGTPCLSPAGAGVPCSSWSPSPRTRFQALTLAWAGQPGWEVSGQEGTERTQPRTRSAEGVRSPGGSCELPAPSPSVLCLRPRSGARAWLRARTRARWTVCRWLTLLQASHLFGWGHSVWPGVARAWGRRGRLG